MEKAILLFTDGSVNTKNKIGVGAYAWVEAEEISTLSSIEVKTQQFHNTSSTKLELEILLYALNKVKSQHIIVYTDSQNLVGLPTRKKKLEASNFISKTGKTHQFKELYIQLFKELDNKRIEIIKVKGHSKKSEKTDIELIFSKVDKAARKGLRQLSGKS